MLLHIKVKADTAAALRGLANTNGIVPFVTQVMQKVLKSS